MCQTAREQGESQGEWRGQGPQSGWEAPAPPGPPLLPSHLALLVLSSVFALNSGSLPPLFPLAELLSLRAASPFLGSLSWPLLALYICCGPSSQDTRAPVHAS